ncbi:POT family [Musa troglodytarum]|uniref:POT family n=1 Tax=Musa troglodytarum TaxID=320322 RepID=A0A9E7GV66_9LILI|nr:POT family [Musa troglodytarum]
MACDPLVQRGDAAGGGVNDGDEEGTSGMEVHAVHHRYVRAHTRSSAVSSTQTRDLLPKVASFGVTANFTVYLVRRFHMKQVVAANTINIFIGTTNFAPLLGAFVSDAYCGRFRTIAYASVVSFLKPRRVQQSPESPPRCSHARHGDSTPAFY